MSRGQMSRDSQSPRRHGRAPVIIIIAKYAVGQAPAAKIKAISHGRPVWSSRAMTDHQTRPELLFNTKNCSLSIVLTATDQKPQKSFKR